MFASHNHNQAKQPGVGKPGRGGSTTDKKTALQPNPLWQSLAMNSGILQPKLTMSQADDPYEREADRIADQVMRMPAPQSTGPGLSITTVTSNRAQRKCAGCEEEEELNLQRKESGAETPAAAPPIVRQALSSSGQPLDAETRAYFEPRFGHDFSRVRIHTGGDAVSAAQSVRARAFTLGDRIAFATGQYSPRTETGRQLLAHELTHVVQRAPGLHASPAEPESKDTDQLPSTDALPPVRLSQFAGVTVVLVGSPTKDDLDPVKFASNAVEAIPKIRASLPDTAVTVLLVTPGFIGRNAYDRAKAMLQGTGANIVEVTTAAEVVSFLNTGYVTSDETTPTRWLNITRFFYFGHGGSTELLLNWTWGKLQELTTDDILQIKPAAFRPAGEAYLFTCNAARGDESFAVVWASHLGQLTIGAQAKTAYNWEFAARHLEQEVEGRLPEWFLGLPYMNAVRIVEPQPNQVEGTGQEENLHRKESDDAETPAAAPPIVHQTLSSPGQPLDAATRAYFEMRFGRDLGGVRIHTGQAASASARAVHALAYTVGSDVVFRDGAYSPDSSAGSRLLAHELTHVLQQGVASSTDVSAPRRSADDLAVSDPGDSAEREADRVAESIAIGQEAPQPHPHALTLARQQPPTSAPAPQAAPAPNTSDQVEESQEIGLATLPEIPFDWMVLPFPMGKPQFEPATGESLLPAEVERRRKLVEASAKEAAKTYPWAATLLLRWLAKIPEEQKLNLGPEQLLREESGFPTAVRKSVRELLRKGVEARLHEDHRERFTPGQKELHLRGSGSFEFIDADQNPETLTAFQKDLSIALGGVSYTVDAMLSLHWTNGALSKANVTAARISIVDNYDFNFGDLALVPIPTSFQSDDLGVVPLPHGISLEDLPIPDEVLGMKKSVKIGDQEWISVKDEWMSSIAVSGGATDYPIRIDSFDIPLDLFAPFTISEKTVQ